MIVKGAVLGEVAEPDSYEGVFGGIIGNFKVVERGVVYCRFDTAPQHGDRYDEDKPACDARFHHLVLYRHQGRVAASFQLSDSRCR